MKVFLYTDSENLQFSLLFNKDLSVSNSKENLILGCKVLICTLVNKDSAYRLVMIQFRRVKIPQQNGKNSLQNTDYKYKGGGEGTAT